MQHCEQMKQPFTGFKYACDINTHIKLRTQHNVYGCFSVPYKHYAVVGLNHQVVSHGADVVRDFLSIASLYHLVCSI